MAKKDAPPARRRQKRSLPPALKPGDHDEYGYLVGDVGPNRNSHRHRLLTQTQLAELLKISERQIRNLEEKGLPHEGFRDTKVYPMPDCVLWMIAYRRRLATPEGHDRRAGLDYLDPRISRAEGALEHATAQCDSEKRERATYGRLLTEEEVIALGERGHYLRGREYLEALQAGTPYPDHPLGPNCTHASETNRR